MQHHIHSPTPSHVLYRLHPSRTVVYPSPPLTSGQRRQVVQRRQRVEFYPVFNARTIVESTRSGEAPKEADEDEGEEGTNVHPLLFLYCPVRVVREAYCAGEFGVEGFVLDDVGCRQCLVLDRISTYDDAVPVDGSFDVSA